MTSRKTIPNASTRTPLALIPRCVLVAMLLSPHFACAQKTLGDVLDAGGMLMSFEQFKQEIVLETVTGPTPTGATIEVVYGRNGIIAGVGSVVPASQSIGALAQPRVSGQWEGGENNSVCVVMRIVGTVGAPGQLPRRCQYWFKAGDRYFLSDSDTDRQARVLARTIKR